MAVAFAEGYASATKDCGDVCTSNSTVVADAIGSVLATATSEVYEEQCDSMFLSLQPGNVVEIMLSYLSEYFGLCLIRFGRLVLQSS